MSYASRQGATAASAGKAPLMRTVLSEFCDAFATALTPILEPVDAAAEVLADAPDDAPVRSSLPALRDLRHEMQTLTDKVAEQQAYVLIFGPLKSGKSTFMNALSGVYVSEVTSLPAYPCMVYVTHAQTPGFVVTRYDGRTTTFTQREALGDVVAEGHRELRQRIREVEAAGGTFDPAVQMPDAIRRVDIRIPIEGLAASGAALVDTPGLYTRMKFGYDRMTRDFRNSAACAIFIVKTDNLFLEQVFDEFGELLELFSRIFIIVNVDSGKKDLRPDGTLAPSLEQQSPWEVIEAFERLSMTAPLKEAFEEGRLEIYPVDLLRAASRRIRERSASAGDEQEDDLAGGQADFDDVLRDLTAFLDSNEYLTAFLDDSLRRSGTLIDELKAVTQGEAVRELGREVATLAGERVEAREKSEAVHRLQQIEWREHVLSLAPRILDRVGRVAAEVRAEAIDDIEVIVAEWFDTPHSLRYLLDEDLLPVFASGHARLVGEAEDTLRQHSSEGLAGRAGGQDLLSDLHAVGVDLQALAGATLDGLKAQAAAASPRPQLPSAAIPVRRSLLDWLLLRSNAKLRRRLFGPPAQQDADIAATVKARLLGDAARETIRNLLLSQLDAMLEETARDFPEQMVRGYAEALADDLRRRLETAQSDASRRLQQIEQRLRDIERVHDGLQALSDKLVDVEPAVETLVERFARRTAAPEDAAGGEPGTRSAAR